METIEWDSNATICVRTQYAIAVCVNVFGNVEIIGEDPFDKDVVIEVTPASLPGLIRALEKARDAIAARG